MLRNRFGDISQACAATNRLRLNLRPEGEDRNMLTRVIGAFEGGVIAMIGCNHHQIIQLQPLCQFRQARIKGF